jgi:hypothetical protein
VCQLCTFTTLCSTRKTIQIDQGPGWYLEQMWNKHIWSLVCKIAEYLSTLISFCQHVLWKYWWTAPGLVTFNTRTFFALCSSFVCSVAYPLQFPISWCNAHVMMRNVIHLICMMCFILGYVCCSVSICSGIPLWVGAC